MGISYLVLQSNIIQIDWVKVGIILYFLLIWHDIESRDTFPLIKILLG